MNYRYAFLVLPLSMLIAHSAIAVPPYFEELIQAGNVKFKFYDPDSVSRKFPGDVQFQFNIQFEFDYRYRAGADGRGPRWIVEPTFTSVRRVVEHTVNLPNNLNNARRWSHPLTQHEFDHIAISMDPRILVLFKHIISKIKTIETELSTDERPDPDELDRIISRQASKRRKAVADLVQTNYLLLDSVSDHGKKTIDRREAFFMSLCSKANLDYARFPYTADALDLVGTEAYLAMKPPFRK